MSASSHQDVKSRRVGLPRTVLRRVLLSLAGASGPLATVLLQWWLGRH